MPGNNAEDRTTIITVAYNSSAVLGDMLASVPEKTPVVIVDNGSQDLTRLLEVVSTRRGKTRLIESDQNLGFGSGCNKGAAEANTEFLFFLNPDTALFPDTVQKLVDAADRYPETSAFNPRIVGDTGRPILKRRSDLVERRKWLAHRGLTQDTVVPVLSGAALFVRRSDFDAIDGFDPEIFLFFEDDDLSVRLSAARGNLMYVNSAKIEHIGGASSGRSSKSEDLKNWHWGFSQIYTLRKHGMRIGCASALLKTGARALSPATVLSPKRRRKYFKRIAGMLTSLRQG